MDLAQAILTVDAGLQPEARTLLTKRLTRMTAGTLKQYLAFEDDAELQLAAIRAIAEKPEPTLLGDLVGLLKDSNDTIADAAHQSLLQATGKSMGRFQGAAKAERVATAQRWELWQRQQGKPP